jgi:hypothetical protein
VGGGGVQQIKLKTEKRESGSGSPLVMGPLNLKMSESRILIRLLRMYVLRNREFGSALSKLWNIGGGGF